VKLFELARIVSSNGRQLIRYRHPERSRRIPWKKP